MTSLNCFQQPSESSGNYQMILEKGGKNPPDVTLYHVAKDLLSFFKGFKCLHEVKKEIEQKCEIVKEHGHDCWPADDIKRAWRETQRIGIISSEGKHWTRVILLQVIKILICDECKQNAAEEESSVASENQSITSSTDEDFFHTEVNSDVTSNDSETSDAELVNEKENTEDRSSQSNDVLETEGAAGGVKQRSKGKRRKQGFDQRDDVKKIATQFPDMKRKTMNSPAASEGQSRTDDSAALESKKNKSTTCICIPFKKMFGSNSTSVLGENVNSNYKLIDGLPSNNEESTPSNESTEIEIRKRKSYVISFDKDKNNAIWVYEILNISTLPLYKKLTFIKDKEDKDEPPRPDSDVKNYERGHLAAAANHRWCQEAYKDTFYFSNMTPQVKILNKGLWKILENECRKKAAKDSVNNVHVYTGPLYQTDSSKYKVVFDKVVPTDYFKVIIVENKNGTVEEPKCYLMPNDESEYPEESKDSKEQTNAKEKYEKKLEELSKYKKTIQEIEEISKLKFTVNNLKPTDCRKRGMWTGNQGKKTVALDITISN
ncbi:hypothetical protein ABG768_020319 [Culter alburnus]|uniref:Uncharacterized protein n=1 Tax=Culter alburnus TaxID=194366 RepID=A0AAW2B193_CULAL